MIAAFDGCGGLGAKKYSICRQHTAAYLAARLVANATLSWFDKSMNCTENGLFAATNRGILELKEQLMSVISNAKTLLDGDGAQLIGTMVKSFPTTMSMILVEQRADMQLECSFIWAGDSRGYILQADGLRQCTWDDLRSGDDPFDNLYEDSPLSNMIHGDGAFSLNVRRVVVGNPAIVFTATDGAFGYLQSPMHFEWLLLKTLCSSDSLAEWEHRLSSAIAEIAGDDYTIVMAIYGWRSFQEIKESFQSREKYLSELLPDSVDVDALRRIWTAYKTSYSECLCGPTRSR